MVPGDRGLGDVRRGAAGAGPPGGLRVTRTRAKSILTRAKGYLRDVCSHSLQPYLGCTYGRALCGVGCYVQHNGWLTRGRAWGSFLEARVNAAELYRAQADRERRWARRARGTFSIFLSSSTDPFVPQERRMGVTRRVLEAMREEPPDELILQTHSHRVTDYLDLYPELARICALRIHLSVESDLDRLPGLPPPASSVAERLAAAGSLRTAGLRIVVTVSPLLPIARPRQFFERIAEVADLVVIDHYVEGDGTPDGSRTARTPLPGVMEAVLPGSSRLDYRDRMAEIAAAVMPGRVGISRAGFALRDLR